MTSGDLLDQKQREVSQMARRMGVDRYAGTERFADITRIMDSWSDQASLLDNLSAESSWLDAKGEIENIMTDMSLNNNSRNELYLLGQTQMGAQGEVSFEEIKNAFSEGWNTLMSQYSMIIANLSQYELGTINRMRDKALSELPLFGTMEEKNAASKMMAALLREIEEKIRNHHQTAEKRVAQREIGDRETIRTIMLSQAESDLTNGHLTQAEYDEVMTLIGRGRSLFEAQLDAMGKYGGDIKSLFKQMDKSIQAAQMVLQQDREATGLSGSGMFVSTNRQKTLGAINNLTNNEKGDGFRTADWRHQARAPLAKVVGRGVPHHPNHTPWVGQLSNQMGPVQRDALPMQFNSSFLPSQPDPAALHRVTNNTGRPQFTMPKNPSKLFGSHAQEQMSRSKMAGLEGSNGLGLTIPVGDGIKLSTLESVVLMGGTVWAIVKVSQAFISAGTQKKGLNLQYGVDKLQTKANKTLAGLKMPKMPSKKKKGISPV